MKIPLDKQLHFLGGVSIAAFALPFGFIAMIAATVIIGAGKEWYDSTGRGNVEWLDFVYTVAGGAVFLGWVLLVDIFL